MAAVNQLLRAPVLISFFQLLLLRATGVVQSAVTSLTVVNNCKHSIWPGVFGYDANLNNTGFALGQGDYTVLDFPAGWSGRVWGRTDCAVDSETNAFTCATGDCGTGRLECSGNRASPPATAVEFRLGGGGWGVDYFFVRVLEGFNLPVEVRPVVPPGGDFGKSQCRVTADCPVDLNGWCPMELAVFVRKGSDDVIACKSACVAFNTDDTCCRKEHSTRETCPQTPYTKLFKDACPDALSYNFDVPANTFSCPSGITDYRITFCPPAGSSGARNLGSAATRIAPAWLAWL